MLKACGWCAEDADIERVYSRGVQAVGSWASALNSGTLLLKVDKVRGDEKELLRVLQVKKKITVMWDGVENNTLAAVSCGAFLEKGCGEVRQ
jgi:hypothetical protein